MAIFGAHRMVSGHRSTLLGSVLSAAAAHDLECLRALDRLRESFADHSSQRGLDLDVPFEQYQRAVTDLSAVIGPVARARLEVLAPFARQLAETAAIAALDEQGLDAFLRPIFDEAGIGERFVLEGAGRASAPVGPVPTEATVELVAVTLDAETLFDHLIAQRETISYGAAYRVMLGAPSGPWRVTHTAMVLQVGRATAVRAVAGIDIRLDALIVNQKTRRPAARHFNEHPEYGDRDWAERFGDWSACAHGVADIRAAAGVAERPAAGIDGTTVKARPYPISAPPVEGHPGVHGLLAPASPPAPPQAAAVEVDASPNAEVADGAPDRSIGAGAPAIEEPAEEPPYGPAIDGLAPLAPAAETAAHAPPARAISEPAASRWTEVLEPAPHVGRSPTAPARLDRRLAARGRTVLGMALACVAAIVLGSLVGSVLASQAPAPPNDDPEAQVVPPLALNDTFAALPTGSDPGWEAIGTGAAGSAVVAPLPTSADRSVRVQSSSADQPFAACRAIPEVRGPMLVQARILLDGLGPRDATIASVRSGVDELARLAVGSAGQILGRGEPPAGTGTAAIAPNLWYDVSLQLDTASRTYHLVVSRAAPGAPVTERDSGWTQQAGGADRICFTAPGAGRSVYVNQLRVTAP